MTSRFEQPTNPAAPDSQIDDSKRYDVYCSQWQHRIILFRSVRFKRTAKLHGRQFPDYVELEQQDGQTVFVSGTSIIMFAEAGSTPSFEKVDI